MEKVSVKRKFDLEKRTLTFAKNIRQFVRKIKNTADVVNDKNQLLRSSGSIGANYIEANETQELMRIFVSIVKKVES